MPIINGLYDKTAELLNTPMVNWREHAEKMSTEELWDIERNCDTMIEHAARLRGYIAMRHGSGCGDQGHASGVRESNKLARGVRKALGFTFPKKEVHF